jgi:hypothetical protein
MMPTPSSSLRNGMHAPLRSSMHAPPQAVHAPRPVPAPIPAQEFVPGQPWQSSAETARKNRPIKW